MPTLLTTSIPSEYIGNTTVALQAGIHRYEIQLRFTVFGELLEYHCLLLDLPESALKLTFSTDELTRIHAEFSYLPYRLILMAFCLKNRFKKSDPWKSVNDKLTELRKRKQPFNLKLPVTHEIVKDIYEFQLPGMAIDKILEVYNTIYLVDTTDDEEIRKGIIIRLGRLGDPRAIETLTKAFKYKSFHTKLDAVSALGDIGDTLVASTLLEAIVNPSLEISLTAVESIGKIRDHKVIPHLKSLLNHPSLQVKINVALALYILGEKCAFQILIDALAMKHTGSFYAIVEEMGNFQETLAVEPLIAMLNKEDTHSFTRKEILDALGKIGDDRAVESLLTALKNKDISVRNKAAEAIGKIKGTDLSFDIIEALYDSLRRGCLQAALVLASIGDTRATPHLIKSLKVSDDDDGCKIVEALGKLGDASVVMPMIKTLKRKNYMTRMFAFKTLGELKDDRAIEPFMEILKNDKLKDIHYLSIYALRDIGKQAVKPLLEGLKTNGTKERVLFADALSHLGNECTLEQLLEVLDDRDSRVCKHLTSALAKLGAKAVEPLIAVLNNRNHPAREYAARELGMLQDSRAVQPLIEALKDENQKVRSNAALALYNYKDLSALNPLIKLLKDNQSTVRRNAAITLGKLGDTRALLPLTYVLTDKEKIVRSAAAYSLMLLGDERAIKPLLSALNNNRDPQVLVSVASALAKLGNSSAVGTLLSTIRLQRMYFSDAHQGLVALGEAAVLPLITELNHKDFRYRKDVVVLLGEIGDKRATEPLKEQLSIETNVKCIKAIQVALEEITQR